LSMLLITKCGLFISQELPEYLGQLIIRFLLQLLCVEFDIMLAFILVVPP
jgi:hypothetical protein